MVPDGTETQLGPPPRCFVRAGKHNEILYRVWEEPVSGKRVWQLLVLHSLHKIHMLVHGAAGVGHFSESWMLKRLQQRFYRAGLHTDVEVERHCCDQCTAKNGPLQHCGRSARSHRWKGRSKSWCSADHQGQRRSAHLKLGTSRMLSVQQLGYVCSCPSDVD